MSVEAVKRLFSYNQWAWKRVFPSLETLPAEDYFAERPFFLGLAARPGCPRLRRRAGLAAKDWGRLPDEAGFAF